MKYKIECLFTNGKWDDAGWTDTIQIISPDNEKIDKEIPVRFNSVEEAQKALDSYFASEMVYILDPNHYRIVPDNEYN